MYDRENILMKQLKCINGDKILYKILNVIDAGVSTEEIRKDPLKYIVSGETKEIVINLGGEGLKVSHEIIKEMARRGDNTAKYLLEKDIFCRTGDLAGGEMWAYLEKKHGKYERENSILIDIIKEDKIHNVGGWTLDVCKVHVETWAYKICKSNDMFGSEYIVGCIPDF